MVYKTLKLNRNILLVLKLFIIFTNYVQRISIIIKRVGT